MKRLFISWFILLFINSYHADSQITLSVDKWVEYIEDLAVETGDEERANALYADLSYRAEHPFNLNIVTEEELRTLPFLSDLQIHSLVQYREKYGAMASLYELKGIEALDFQTIELLLPFVTVGEYKVDKPGINVKNLLKQGSNELQIRYDQCFQQKQGYRSYPDSILEQYPNRTYLGEPFYTSLRYSYSFDDRIQWGVVAEKDAGEPFWNQHHKGYDYYSVHLVLKDMAKWLKNLCIGDYKLSFGQGLVASNDFSPSRNAIVAQAERRTSGFRRHFSTNEQDFYRGIAATFRLKTLEMSLFYSRRKMDAVLNDSLSFSSIKRDGLHRLQRDWEKRHNLTLQSYGGSLQYRTPQWQLGITALSYSFSPYSMQPVDKPCYRFHFRGRNNMNASVNYLWTNQKVKWYGETAISRNGGWATLNGMQLTPVSYFSLLALFRHYDRRYQALFSHAFSMGGSVQNEQGVYVGMQWEPFSHWKLSTYVDLFRYPWLKYGVDAPSSGKEYMVQVDFTPNEVWSAYLRYRFREKEKNGSSDDPVPSILPYSQQRLRGQLACAPNQDWLLKTSVEGVFYKEQQQQSRSFMVSQRVGWIPHTLPIQLDGYVGWFHTDDYYTRLSSYEKNMLYTFYMPSFYGKGIRLAFTFRWDWRYHLSLSGKVAHTHYSDRDVISSGLEEIEGKAKTDLYLLVRWKF